MRRNLKAAGAVALAAGVWGLGTGRADAATINVTTDITASETWTADNEYILTQPIYVASGATLTIEPGTVVRGEPQSIAGANDPGTLIITRGSKLRAIGTKFKPIVFTNLDDNVGGNPGTFPYDSPLNALPITGTWGGLIVLGRTYVANNTPGAPNAAREVQIEGLTAVGGLGLYGNCMASPVFPDCDDDSGVISYLSIRYGGFNLSANNEINGLTLGAVGRSTEIDHVEVFQNKDDGIEFFGGTVGVHHVAAISGGDDGLDYDEGFRGKVQFAFVMQGTPGNDKSDKGAEQDGGNNPGGSQPFAIPTMYNLTFVGLGQKDYTARPTNTALHYRDNAGGRDYNSFFADFGGATMCIEGLGVNTSCERAATPYVVDGTFHQGPPSDFQLELQDNCFWCFGKGSVLGDATNCGAGSYCDNGVFTKAALDNEYLDCLSPRPIRTLVRTPSGVATTPDPIIQIDPRPAAGSGLLVTNRVAAGDGFLTPAPWKGAFREKNWLAKWSNLSRLTYFPACGMGGVTNAVPDEAKDLDFTDDDHLVWTAPALTGGMGVQVFDVLRATSTTGFGTPTCVETDDADTTAEDTAVPAPGDVDYYLVRAGNGCGDGTLGFQSSGAERSGASCP